MLQVSKVAAGLEESLRASRMLAFAVITTDGIVLESRERRDPSRPFPPPAEPEDDTFTVGSKMQTKVYALFAAELWRQNSGVEWAGAEAHRRRIVVRATGDELVMVVASNVPPWSEISARALEAAKCLAEARVD